MAYFVYLVRNNIFHGEKNTIQMMDPKQQVRLQIYSAILSSLNSLLFVVAERKLDWVRPDIRIGNERMENGVEWRRAFIWSGFEFETQDGTYVFKKEKEENRKYLGRILDAIGNGNCFDGVVFEPRVAHVDRRAWLNAVETLHGGAERGSFDELPIMDTYVGGIVRSVNKLGFKTSHSCDGHGTRRNTIILSDQSQSYVLDACIRVVSKGKYGYDNRSMVKTRRAPSTRPGIREEIDRYFLLDIAELLYDKMKVLEKIIKDIDGGHDMGTEGKPHLIGCASFGSIVPNQQIVNRQSQQNKKSTS